MIGNKTLYGITSLLFLSVFFLTYWIFTSGLTSYLIVPASLLLGVVIVLVVFVHPRWFLFLTLFLLPLETLQQVVPDYLTFGKLTSLLAFTGFIFMLFFRYNKGFQWNNFLTLFFLYAAYCIISYALHYNSGTPLAPLLSIISMPLLALLAYNLVNTRRDFCIAFLFLGAGFLISNILTMFQYILQDPIIDIGQQELGYDIATGAVKYSGTFGNANSFAIFLLSSLFIFGYLVYYSRHPFNKLLFTVIFLSSVTALILTASAAAILGLVIAIILFLWFKTRYRIVTVLLAGALIVLLLMIPNPLTTRILYRFEEEGHWRDPSTITRMRIFEKSWNMFLDKPLFGIGFGQFDVQSPDYMTYLMHPKGAHNNFLKVLSETGIVGFILYSLLLLWFIQRLLILYKTRKNAAIRSFIIVALMTLVATIIFSLFHTTLRSSVLWFIYALIAKTPYFLEE